MNGNLNVNKCCGMTYTASISNLCDTKYYFDADSVSDLGVRLDPK